MAQIREELILYDRFTNTFTSYIRQGEQAAGVTRQAQQATEQFSKSQQTAAASVSGLTSKLQGLVGSYLGLQGLRGLVNLSDTMASTTARLDSMNDGLQTTAELNDMIFQSAQRSRGAYQATADMVAKLGTLAGDAFGSSAEVVAFAEQINKQMVLSGASTMGAQAAMLQLTQAMSSGVLRGEELNSILEQAPTIAQAIADYLGVTTGEMRELASEGRVTAEVVKAAMFSAAEETNAKFEQMPMTWGQVWTSFQNIALKALQPVLSGINWLSNNIEIIGPIVLGVAAAFLVYTVAANGAAVAAKVWTAAQAGLNAVLALNPVGIVIMAIVLLIAAIYAVVGAVNKATDSSISATGIIAGAFAVLGAFIFNQFVVPVQNVLAALGNFIGNLFTKPVDTVKLLFLDLATTVLGHVSAIAHGIEGLVNKIPGVSVDMTSAIDSLYNQVQTAAQGTRASSWTEYFDSWDKINLGDAWDAGYNWGSNLFSGLSGSPFGFDYDEYLDSLPGLTADVGAIKNSVSMSEEDLRSLVDMAERQYVNNINLTTRAPVINVHGQNTGNSPADTRAFMNTLTRMLAEQTASSSDLTTAQVF